MWHIWLNTCLRFTWASPGGSVIKNSPATQETQVQSLRQGDPLEEEMATLQYSWIEGPGAYRPWCRKRIRLNLATKQQNQSKRGNGTGFFFFFLCFNKESLIEKRELDTHRWCGHGERNLIAPCSESQLLLGTWAEVRTQTCLRRGAGDTGHGTRWNLHKRLRWGVVLSHCPPPAP